MPHPPSRQREETFRAAYDAGFSALLGYALRRVADPADAADVVSETFLTAWRRWDDAPPGDVRPWLFGIARNVLANQARTLRRRERLGGRLRDLLSSTALPDPATGVAERDRIRRALGALGEDDRELLTLVGWDDLSPTEAAEVLGIAPGTARMRLSRARARLENLLADGDAPTAAGHDQPKEDR